MNSKDTFFSRKRTLNIRGELFTLNEPKVMGVLNITPDSFYNGGKYNNEKEIISQVENFFSEGAAFVDIGAYSSRPGAVRISEEEELNRLVPVINILRRRFPDSIFSVDTFRSEIARKMVNDYGVDMINDISAGNMDPKMFDVIAELNVPYIIMHMQGTPQTMQDNPQYENVTKDILTFFAGKIQMLKLMGVNDVIIDPGFGFGKTINHNYELLIHLDDFKIFGLPILAGVSRKSMIWKLLGNSPKDALNGTIVLNTVALLKGADIIRVHDVKEAVEIIKIVQKLIYTEEHEKR
jgi:dihydropteroate synthase